MEPKALELLTEPHFAALTTLMPDGSAQTHLVWVNTDGEHVLVNTEVHRQKARNIARDPRVTVLVFDREDMYRWVEIRGEVVETITGPEARAHIDELSRKYTGHDYAPTIQSERVMYKIAPHRRITSG